MLSPKISLAKPKPLNRGQVFHVHPHRINGRTVIVGVVVVVGIDRLIFTARHAALEAIHKFFVLLCSGSRVQIGACIDYD